MKLPLKTTTGCLPVLVALSFLGPMPACGALIASVNGHNTEFLTAFDRVVGWIAIGIEAAGIGIITVGGLIATIIFFRHLLRSKTFDSAYNRYRSNLGRAILLGLEFLVAADIVGTVAVDPTFQNLAILGLIVAIRTFLSFSLEVEIEGQWPWQKSATETVTKKADR